MPCLPIPALSAARGGEPEDMKMPWIDAGGAMPWVSNVYQHSQHPRHHSQGEINYHTANRVSRFNRVFQHADIHKDESAAMIF
jgi:hypothetical protein